MHPWREPCVDFANPAQSNISSHMVDPEKAAEQLEQGKKDSIAGAKVHTQSRTAMQADVRGAEPGHEEARTWVS